MVQQQETGRAAESVPGLWLADSAVNNPPRRGKGSAAPPIDAQRQRSFRQ